MSKRKKKKKTGETAVKSEPVKIKVNSAKLSEAAQAEIPETEENQGQETDPSTQDIEIPDAAEAVLEAVEAEEISEETEVSEENCAGETVEETPLEMAERQRDEYLDLAQRTRADMENFRRRVQREREMDRVHAQAKILRELLSPIDDLDRALQEAEKNDDFETLFSGLKMVRDSVWKALKSEDFDRIEANPGTVFDPNFHEAMMQMPNPEIPQGAIVQELAPGYKLGELVLRPAKVAVSAGGGE